VTRHGFKQLAAFDLTRHVLDSRNGIRRSHHDLGCPGMAMPIRVLPRYVDLKARMPMVLDGSHIESTPGKLLDNRAHDGGLSRIMPPHKRDGGALKQFVHAVPFSPAAL
jgi:hypothetical protein